MNYVDFLWHQNLVSLGISHYYSLSRNVIFDWSIDQSKNLTGYWLTVGQVKSANSQPYPRQRLQDLISMSSLLCIRPLPSDESNFTRTGTVMVKKMGPRLRELSQEAGSRNLGSTILTISVHTSIGEEGGEGMWNTYPYAFSRGAHKRTYRIRSNLQTE